MPIANRTLNNELVMTSESIATASANSVEPDLGCTSRIYFDNMTLTSQKPCQHNNKCDCSKKTVINEVSFDKTFPVIKIMDFNRAKPTCYTSIRFSKKLTVV